jgi:hypothetical protein
MSRPAERFRRQNAFILSHPIEFRTLPDNTEAEARERANVPWPRTPADKMQKTPSARRGFSNSSIDRTDKWTQGMGQPSGMRNRQSEFARHPTPASSLSPSQKPRANPNTPVTFGRVAATLVRTPWCRRVVVVNSPWPNNSAAFSRGCRCRAYCARMKRAFHRRGFGLHIVTQLGEYQEGP